MTGTIRRFMLVEAASFVAAALIHLGVLIAEPVLTRSVGSFDIND